MVSSGHGIDRSYAKVAMIYRVCARIAFGSEFAPQMSIQKSRRAPL